MIVTPIKTRKVLPKACTLTQLLDESLHDVPEKSVVAITSKVVALCEGRVVPMEGTDKDELIAQETQLYLPRNQNPYNVTLSITRNQLVASGGVDESNSAGMYVLWPQHAQATANAVREYLCKKFNRTHLGVIITDSTTRPLQWGTTGISIAHSGFKALHSYIGEKDLFGRPFEYQTNNIQNGLAAAAVVTMGEGDECKPLAVLSDLDFVEFVDRNPTSDELRKLLIDPKVDLYAPLLTNVAWHKGRSA